MCVIDVRFRVGACMGAGVGPGNMRSVEAVDVDAQVLSEEARLDRIIRGREVRHRAGRHTRVVEARVLARRVRDLRGRDVVAAARFASTVGTVVESHPEVPVPRHGAPGLPLGRLPEARVVARGDVRRLAPGKPPRPRSARRRRRCRKAAWPSGRSPDTRRSCCFESRPRRRRDSRPSRWTSRPTWPR